MRSWNYQSDITSEGVKSLTASGAGVQTVTSRESGSNFLASSDTGVQILTSSETRLKKAGGACVSIGNIGTFGPIRPK